MDIVLVDNFDDNVSFSLPFDGTTVVFALPNTPVGSLELVKNGSCLVQGTDYTLAGNVVTFVTAPLTTDVCTATYRY